MRFEGEVMGVLGVSCWDDVRIVMVETCRLVFVDVAMDVGFEDVFMVVV